MLRSLPFLPAQYTRLSIVSAGARVSRRVLGPVPFQPPRTGDGGMVCGLSPIDAPAWQIVKSVKRWQVMIWLYCHRGQSGKGRPLVDKCRHMQLESGHSVDHGAFPTRPAKPGILHGLLRIYSSKSIPISQPFASVASQPVGSMLTDEEQG